MSPREAGAILLGVGALFLAPVFVGCEVCGDHEFDDPYLVNSGEYLTAEVVLDGPTFRLGAENKTITVDRESNTVTIRYERDGSQFVERWDIVDATIGR